MNKKEFGIFVSALRTYYPKENILPNEQALELWYKQLQDIPYQVAEVTLNKWVATNRWSPSISDIREQAAGLTQGTVKDWGEAWQAVIDSIGKCGYYRESEALESFDELTRTTVKRLGYKNICISENIAADRANFRMIYEQEQERQKRDAQLPPKLKALISNMPMLLEEGGE